MEVSGNRRPAPQPSILQATDMDDCTPTTNGVSVMMSAVRSMLGCIFLATVLATGIRDQTRPRIEVVRLKDRFYRLTSTVPCEVNSLAYVIERTLCQSHA